AHGRAHRLRPAPARGVLVRAGPPGRARAAGGERLRARHLPGGRPRPPRARSDAAPARGRRHRPGGRPAGPRGRPGPPVPVRRGSRAGAHRGPARPRRAHRRGAHPGRRQLLRAQPRRGPAGRVRRRPRGVHRL
ncbi:MAG: hypothetical protein AVDCRST_MAG61-34, partial [uncultured Friedmanniella sp.]